SLTSFTNRYLYTQERNRMTSTNTAGTSASMSGAQYFNYVEEDEEAGWDALFANNEDGEENDREDRGAAYQSMRDCIIFLIDASPPMFERDPITKERAFDNAIKCLIQTITDKIITSDSDLIGLCLYGTDKNKNLNDFENIYVMFDLDIPDPKTILLLEDILEADYSSFGGSTTKEFAFCDALWTCSSMFSN
ncbi:hypothetical protein SAMD00019534_073330, partial [Acytostelium subglobosum LB1]|uniref:hypothetical protein n=1 Tax=Acytostelium subglobosum LB1 TaxID=1410327 RepID=UPI0006449EAD